MEVRCILCGGKLWCHYNLAKLMTDQKFARFSPSKFLHLNIKQIDWKIFLRHAPNNLQLEYHQSPLDSHAYGLWIM